MPPEPALTTLPTGRAASLLGMRVDELDYGRVINQVVRWADAAESRFMCVSTVHMVMEAYDHADFRRVVNSADLVGSDGMPVIWVSRMLGIDQQRVFAPDLMELLCAEAARRGIKVGFYGSSQTVIDDLCRKMPERHPGLDIAYACSPPFRALTDAELDTIADQINAADARILFVGLGCPKQERWMQRARPRVKAVMLGVGWAFDVCSGHSHAAPGFVQRAGMEWLYRLVENPRKLWRRHLRNNPRFIVLAALQAMRLTRYKVPENVGAS